MAPASKRDTLVSSSRPTDRSHCAKILGVKVVAGFETRDSYPAVIMRNTAVGSAVSQQRLRTQLCTHTMGSFIVPTCNLTQC